MFINLDQNHKHKLTDLREDMNPKPKKKNQKKKKNGELSPPRLYLRSRTPARPLSIPDHQDL